MTGEEITVRALHGQWVAILDRMTSSPLGQCPPPNSGEMRKLMAAARGLEELIADTPSGTIAEVRLKLTMSGSAGMLTKCRALLVDSTCCDLRQLDPAFRLDR